MLLSRKFFCRNVYLIIAKTTKEPLSSSGHWDGPVLVWTWFHCGVPVMLEKFSVSQAKRNKGAAMQFSNVWSHHIESEWRCFLLSLKHICVNGLYLSSTQPQAVGRHNCSSITGCMAQANRNLTTPTTSLKKQHIIRTHMDIKPKHATKQGVGM